MGGPERSEGRCDGYLQYAELFLTESREHVAAINQALLELERDAARRRRSR